jgi:nucleoside-diphosphate-sugar epimerase
VFLVVGAEVYTLDASFNLLNELKQLLPYNWPTLLLSSSSVYSDRAHDLSMREIEPMDEAQGHVITSPLDAGSVRPITALLAEHLFVQRQGRTVVVRPFNVYGPRVEHGVVANFVAACRADACLTVHSPGRQVRTFLWEDDFTAALGVLVTRLLKGHRGIYNLGSDEQVEILSLAKSVGHAFGKEPHIEVVDTDERHAWWKVPSLDRARVDAKLKQKVSLRSGLFMLAERT